MLWKTKRFITEDFWLSTTCQSESSSAISTRPYQLLVSVEFLSEWKQEHWGLWQQSCSSPRESLNDRVRQQFFLRTWHCECPHLFNKSAHPGDAPRAFLTLFLQESRLTLHLQAASLKRSLACACIFCRTRVKIFIARSPNNRFLLCKPPRSRAKCYQFSWWS